MKHIRMKTAVLMAVLAMLVFTGCQSGDSYRNLVPADAVVVSSYNLQTLFEESKFTDSNLPSKIEEFLDDIEDDALRDKCEAILKDPAEAGIDLRKPIYCFLTPDMTGGIVMKTYKESKVEELLEALRKGTDSDMSRIKEGDGYKYVTDTDVIIAFNSDAVLFLVNNAETSKLKRKVEKLMSVDEEDRYFAQDNPFDDEKAPMCLMVSGDFLNSSAVMDEMSSYQRRQMEAANDMLKEMYGYSYEDVRIYGKLTFEKNEAVIGIKYYGKDDTVTKKIKESAANKPLTGEFAKYAPASQGLVVAVGIDGGKYLSLLKKLPMYDKLERNLEEIRGFIDVEGAIASIDGDMMFTLTDYYTDDWRERPEYNFGVYGSFSSTSFVTDTLLMLVQAESLGGGQYRVGNGDEKAYVDVQANQLSVTRRALSEAESSADYAGDIKGNLVYARIELPRKLLRSDWKELNGLVKTITIKIPDALNAEIRIATDDADATFPETAVSAIEKLEKDF